MNYKNIKTNNKGLYYYKTDDFATIKIAHYFTYKLTKENYLKASILCIYLFKANSIYKSEKEICDREKELYGTYLSDHNFYWGNKGMFSFELKMINPRRIGEDYFEESLNFYRDILLNVNFNNSRLKKDVFEQIKKDIINEMKDNFKNPRYMCNMNFYTKLLPNSSYNSSRVIDLDEFIDRVNNVTDKDIIDFYNELMSNYVLTRVFGNLLDKEIKYIDNLFDFKQIDFDYDYFVKDKMNTKDIEIVDSNTSQSSIRFCYDIKDYSKDKYYLYDNICWIINDSNGPIQKIFRDSLGIIYSGYCGYVRGMFYVVLQIDKKNKDKAIKGMKEFNKYLHDKKKMDNMLTFIKELRKNLLITHEESLDANVSKFNNYIFNCDRTEEEVFELTNKLSVEDIISEFDNFEYKCLYFYRGDKNEE